MQHREKRIAEQLDFVRSGCGTQVLCNALSRLRCLGNVKEVKILDVAAAEKSPLGRHALEREMGEPLRPGDSQDYAISMVVHAISVSGLKVEKLQVASKTEEINGIGMWHIFAFTYWDCCFFHGKQLFSELKTLNLRICDTVRLERWNFDRIKELFAAAAGLEELSLENHDAEYSSPERQSKRDWCGLHQLLPLAILSLDFPALRRLHLEDFRFHLVGMFDFIARHKMLEIVNLDFCEFYLDPGMGNVDDLLYTDRGDGEDPGLKEIIKRRTRFSGVSGWGCESQDRGMCDPPESWPGDAVWQLRPNGNFDLIDQV